MRLALAAIIGATACASAAQAQSWVDDTTANLNRQALSRQSFTAQPSDAFGPALDADRAFAAVEDNLSPWAATSRDVWIEGEGYSDRVRVRAAGPVRRADGSPLPPRTLDEGALEALNYDVTFVRGWPSTLGYTADGMAVTFTPHAGVGVGTRGGVAEAGATVRIGRDLVPEGQEQFGDRARWYIYAAGSGRAVGYNFARNRDGDYARSGMTHDAGIFLGDAQLGVAMRRGAVQSSFGVIYRELEPGVIRNATGMITDVSEGMVAFQFSIKPE